jgi:hypothetical protein
MMNAHTKYENPIAYHSKVIANVKVFKKYVKVQGQGQGSNLLVQLERSCHKEYSYEI